MSYTSDGVLFEDETIQIGVKAEYHGHLGRLAIFIGNKISAALTNLKTVLEVTNPSALVVRFHDAPVTEIQGLAQVQELVHVECKEFFKDSPVLRMNYMAGEKERTLVVRLPVFLSRFIEGVTLEQGPFFERWKIIGGTSSLA